MKKYALCSILLAYGLSSNASFAQTQNAQTQTVDISKITCNDLRQSTVGDIAVVSVWLSGYYHGRVHKTNIDLKKYVENSKLLGDLCASDLKQTVMQTIEKQIRAQEGVKTRIAPPPTSSEKKG
jgi:acid stress chaperone HdeB